MKKILFFINTLGTGGAEHVLIDIVNNLDSKKFDITIKTIYDINVYQNQINSNIKVESYYHTKKNHFLDNLCRRFLYYKLKFYKKEWLYKKMIRNKYDIEIAFLEGMATKIISGSNNDNSKKIAWVHTDIKNNTESYIFYKSLNEHKKTYRRFNEIYCVSDEAVNAFKEVFKINDNIYAMYNIIDKKKIIEKSKEIGDLSSDFNIINIGRLTEQKGHLRLLKVYSEALQEIDKKINLYIIGDGPEKGNIKKEIANLKLKNVYLLGNQNNPYKYLKNADLYVCSSFAEGYSLVILEALTLGVPVLTTNCSGMKQILHNGEFGMIVDNNNDALKNGLIEIINNKELLRKYKNSISNNYIKYENKIAKIEKQILK